MRVKTGVLLITVFVYLLTYSIAFTNKLPTSNIAIEFSTGNAALPDQRTIIISELEEEMRLLGFMGRLRILENEISTPISGETLVKIRILKNRWATRKLLSIPYIINRYTREYIMESFIQVPGGRNGMAIKRLKAQSALPARAQYVSNDKYDPALFPNHNERIQIEESTRRLFAKKLAEHLLAQLK